MTRKTAIDKMCKNCIYDSNAKGTWVKQVEECTSTGCALYCYRPLTKAGKAERNRKNIAKTRDKGRFTTSTIER